METLKSIRERRSIRKFINKDIPKELMEKILEAGMLAPSAKNRQPWKFVVITDKEKPAMLNALHEGIENEKKLNGLMPNFVQYLAAVEYTVHIMKQAPINVFVFNVCEKDFLAKTSIESKFWGVANIQSIGAAIENMILAATDLGIGSLWICDVFSAYKEICQWLNEDSQLVAAVSFGYSDEAPNARPRKDFCDIVEWR